MDEIIKILINDLKLQNILLNVDLKRDSAEIMKLVNYQDLDNSILKTNPELKDYWNSKKNKEFTMDKVTHSSDKKVWWKCPRCKYEWKRKVSEMSDKRRKNICPQCKGAV